MRQRDQTDCGPTCLAYLCRSLGRPESVARLRQWAGTDRCGTTALGLIQAARRVGFELEGIKGSVAEAVGLPVPFIAHVILPTGHAHFVVVDRVVPDGFAVMDPAVGEVARWSRERFLVACSGVFLRVAAPSTAEASGGERAVPPSRAMPSSWIRLARVLWPHRRLVLATGLGAVVATVLSLAFPLYVKQVVDAVVPRNDRWLLAVLGLAMVLFVGMRQALGWIQGVWTLRLGQRLDAQLILGYHRHLLTLPATFHEGMRVGDLLARVGDAIKVRTFLSTTLVGMALHPLLLVGALGALVVMHPMLGLVAGVLLAVQAALAPWVSRVSRERQRELLRAGSEWQAHLAESWSNHATVRALRWEAREKSRAEQQLTHLLRASRGVVITGLWTGVVGQGFAQLYTVATLWVGAALVLQGQLTLGELMSAYALSAYVAGPAAALLTLSGSVQEAVAATERLFEVMDLEGDGPVGSRQGSDPVGSEVRFERVSLQPAGRLPILRDLSVAFASGCWTTVAGPSGGGKSSVLALVQGTVRPSTGQVSLGGRDLSTLEPTALGEMLSVLPQRVELFSGTILDNLTGGDGRPDAARLAAACRDAGVGEWIEALPQGFGTVLLEAGATLSGGQRQRLALARALYRPCRVLVLDEPTSALDAQAEREIVAALRRRVEAGLTLIVASHAPALLAAADRVLHLSDGGCGRGDDVGTPEPSLAAHLADRRERATPPSAPVAPAGAAPHRPSVARESSVERLSAEGADEGGAVGG